MLRHHLALLSLSLSGALAAGSVACDDGSEPASPAVSANDGGVDGGDGGDRADAKAKVVPAFDPAQGTFAAARTTVGTALAIAIKAELQDPDRLFPQRDPLFVASAISELLRAGATGDCLNGQYGCPKATTALALLDEYAANKASLVSALKRAQALSHAWGRIALAHALLGSLNLLEKVGVLGIAQRDALALEANKLAGAATAPATTPAGIYPELPANASLYRFAFKGIRPAPAAPESLLTAANAFIGSVLGSLAIGPKPEDPLAIGPKQDDPLAIGPKQDDPLAIGPKPEDPFAIGPKPDDPAIVAWSLSKGLSDQGLDPHGVLAPGSSSGKTLETLLHFNFVVDTPQVSKVDAYFASIDALVTKAKSGSVTEADWAAYAGAADELAATFDAASGALGGAVDPVPPGVADAKPATGGLEEDPNVLERASGDSMVRDGSASLLWKEPVVGLGMSGAVRGSVAPRRAPVVMPAGIDLPLPGRPAVNSAALDLLLGTAKGPIVLSWVHTVASSPLDHVDVRVENVTTKKTVFHKVYRRGLDLSIASKTALPVEAAWFAPGQLNELEVRVSAVDRLGVPSALACAPLTMQVDDAATFRPVAPGAGKCFSRAADLGEAPLAGAPVPNAIVIGKYLGSPFRPTTVYVQDTVKILNDTTTPRRLRSLFTPEYAEIPEGVDPATRKDPTTPTGLAPLDSGVIAAGATVDVPLPAGTPDGYAFTLFDADNAPAYRVRVIRGQAPSPSFW